MEALAAFMGQLTAIEAIEIIGTVFLCVILLLLTIMFVLDKLNIKRFSLVPLKIEFYDDGDTKVSRISGRKKPVVRKRKTTKRGSTHA